jgi:uncharacterized protein DUF3592
MLALQRPQSATNWCVLFIGGILLYFTATQLVMGLWSFAWVKVDGVIIESKPYRAYRIYRVNLRYKYSYEGREYIGDVYRFKSLIGLDMMQSREVDLTQGRYPVGERVQLSVNPINPSESVLEAGVDRDSFLYPGAAFLIPLAAFLPDPKARRKNRGSPAVDGVSFPPADAAGDRAKKKPRYRTAKALLVFGGLLLISGVKTLYIGVASPYWPTTEGRVFYSTPRSAGQSYSAQLWYEYNVNGKRYVAGDYGAGGNFTPYRDVARAAATRYSAGRLVTVYYNPSDPSQALLEPGLWYGNLIIPSLGLVVLGVAWLAKKFSDAMEKLSGERLRRLQTRIVGEH